MSVAVLLKIFADCCMMFSILGSGPFPFEISLLIPAAICGLSAGASAFFENRNRTALQRLCCLLPLCSLLLAQGVAQLVILSVPAAYTAIVILRGNTMLDYASYRHYFVRSLGLLGTALTVLGLWSVFSDITKAADFGPDFSLALRYGLLYLLCGVMLQRQLRLGIEKRAEGGRRQFASLLVTALVVAAGCAVAEPMLRQSAAAVLQVVVYLLLSPLALIVMGVARLIDMLQPGEPDEEVLQQILEHWARIVRGEDMEQPPPMEAPVQSQEPNYTVWIIVAAALVVIAAVFLIRSFLRRRTYADPIRQTSQVVAAPKKKKDPRLSNRGRVRQLYREFLKVERNLGMKLSPCDTSADVLSRIHPTTDKASAEELREVYLAARYDDRASISRSQAEKAKRALKGTRRQ